MFCFSCKYISESPIKECVDSILEFHPDEKIVIVDSQSEDKSYYDIFSNYSEVDILDNVNNYRIPGALHQTYKKYPNESHYVLIQDSIIFKKSIDSYLTSSDQFVSFMYFPEDVQRDENCEEYQYYKKIFSQTDYEIPSLGQKIYASFGPLFIAKKEIMKKFYDKGLLENFKSSSKLECQCAERIYGICAEQEGFNPSTCNIEGNFLERVSQVNSHDLEYFDKIFLYLKR